LPNLLREPKRQVYQGRLVIAGAWGFYSYSVNELVPRFASEGLAYQLRGLQYALPGGVLGILTEPRAQEPMPSVLRMAVTGIVGHVIVMFWFLNRYGQSARRPKAVGVGEWWLLSGQRRSASPFRTQLGAIAWKQCRETGPLALFAVTAILSLALYFQWYTTPRQRFWEWHELGELLSVLALAVASMVTLVSGMGVFIEDLKPKVDRFWRSLPVTLYQWFAVKYLTGFAVLVVTFGSVTLVAVRWSRQSVDHETIWWWTLGYLLLYSMSLATFAYLRQPIYSAVLTIFLLYFGSFAVVVIANTLRLDNAAAYPIAAVLTALALTITLAYLAVKHDWGWKR